MNPKALLLIGLLAILALGGGVYMRFASRGSFEPIDRQEISSPVPRVSGIVNTNVRVHSDWPLWTSVWGWTVHYPKEWHAQGNEPSGVDFSTCPTPIRCFEKGQAQIRIFSRYNTPELKKIVGTQPQAGTHVTVAGLDATQSISRNIRQGLMQSFGPIAFMDTSPEEMSNDRIVTSFEKGNFSFSISLEGDIDQYQDTYDAMLSTFRFISYPNPSGAFAEWKVFRRWGEQFYYPSNWTVAFPNDRSQLYDEATLRGNGITMIVRSNKGFREFPPEQFKKVKIRIGDPAFMESIRGQYSTLASFWVDAFEELRPQGKAYAMYFSLPHEPREEGQTSMFEITVDAGTPVVSAKATIEKILGTLLQIEYQFYYE